VRKLPGQERKRLVLTLYGLRGGAQIIKKAGGIVIGGIDLIPDRGTVLGLKPTGNQGRFPRARRSRDPHDGVCP